MIKDILHLKAPDDTWLNDPNGFIYYRGKYHLFYQHFPYAPVWGTMHWGHAVSDDLVHWEHLKTAIFPTKAYDMNGIFSGSAVIKDGAMHLYYTAVRYLEIDEDNIHIAKNDNYETSQALMVSEDGFHFDNWHGKTMVIPPGGAKDSYRAARDPKVWQYQDEWYMVLGSSTSAGTGCILFYKSRDGLDWQPVNRYEKAGYGRIIECPDIFQTNGQYVLTASLMYMMDDGLIYDHHAICTLADFQEGSCQMHLPDEYQMMDHGLDFYAAQSTCDKDGRRITIGWMRMPEAADGRWNGLMSLPRVVEVEAGHICFRVHPEIDAFCRRELAEREEIDYDAPYRLKVRMQEGERLNIGGYSIRLEEGCVQTDRSRVYPQGPYRLKAHTPPVGDECDLDIFVDKNLIEIFVNNGWYVLSSVVYGLQQNIEGRIDTILQ